MKVQQLIDILKNADPDAVVVVPSRLQEGDSGRLSEVLEVIAHEFLYLNAKIKLVYLRDAEDDIAEEVVNHQGMLFYGTEIGTDVVGSVLP